jgi:hypothetical protein
LVVLGAERVMLHFPIATNATSPAAETVQTLVLPELNETVAPLFVFFLFEF